MPINGLLEGLAAGVEKGLGAYQTARRNRLDEEKMRRDQAVQDAHLEASGYTKDETGQYVLSDALKKKKEFESSEYDPNEQIGRAYTGLLGKAGITGVSSNLSPAEYKRFDPILKTWATVQGANIKAKAAAVPEENKDLIKDLTKTSAAQIAIKNKIDQSLNQLKDPNVEKRTKLDLAFQLGKTLNSDIGKDALGAEEANRLLYNLQTLRTDPGRGVGVGPDLNSFIKQVEETSNTLEGSLTENANVINKAKAGKGLLDVIPKRQKGKLPGPPGVGAIIDANGKRYQVINANGDLKEL